MKLYANPLDVSIALGVNIFDHSISILADFATVKHSNTVFNSVMYTDKGSNIGVLIHRWC
jgi:hypothetical protein